LALGVASYAVLMAVAVWADLLPDPTRVAFFMAVAIALTGLLVDSVPSSAPSWRVDVARPAHPPGHDHRTSLYLRVMEGHLTARHPDAALRDRLATAASGALTVRHGLGLRDPAARELLGPDLVRVLTGPPRRLSKAEIDRCVTRIELL